MALLDIAATLVNWDNDLFSPLEDATDNGHNLVQVLRTALDCTPRQAIAEALAMRQAVMSRFLSLQGDLKQHADPSTRCFLESVGHLVRGSLQWWFHESARYRSERDLSAGLPRGVTATKGNGYDGPLSIDSISWWWDES